MQTLKMDFQSQSAPPVVPVMQYDAQSRFIGITLYNGGVPYEAPEGANYTVQYLGPGANNMGWYDTITLPSGTRKAVIVDSASKNVVTLELAEQALRVSGNVFVNLCVVTNTGYMLKTFPILCRVTGAAFPDTVAVQSFFYVTGITSEQWLAYVTACQDAQKRAEDAAAKFVTDPTLSISGKAADAKATGSKITAVEKNIAEKIPVGVNIKNFLDTSALKNGGYLNTDTGEVIAYSDEYYSDFITTKANDILVPATFNPATNKWEILAPMRWCFYDANKTFISGFITNKNTTPVPANAAYMRVSISNYYLHLSSTLIVTNGVLQTMTNPEDRVQYGNIIPTVYDGDGKDRIIVNGGYSVKSYDKLFFKFSNIKYYKNGTSVTYNYNFPELKQQFPNNWQGYPTSKMSDCMFLNSGEILTFNPVLSQFNISTRPYFLENAEKEILVLGFDNTNQTYGPFEEQSRNTNDDSYERQGFETFSNDTLTSFLSQTNGLFDLLYDEKFCFAWLSDNHMYGTVGIDETDMTDLAIGYADKFINFDAIFNTGDIIQERANVSGLNALRKASNKFDPKKLLFAQGNHDRNVIPTIITKHEYYNAIHRWNKNENAWGSKENVYYYRDFNACKIRVIVLNVCEHMYDNNAYDESKFGYSNDQLEWLANTALKIESDWSVIVLTHDAPVEMNYNSASIENNPQQLIQILEAFKNGTSTKITYTDTKHNGIFSVNVTTSFSGKGTIIGVFAGHAHCDDMKKVNGINYVQIVCAYIDVVNDYSGYKNRPAFSSKAYAFDIGIVDTENRTLKLKRIGYGADRAINY